MVKTIVNHEEKSKAIKSNDTVRKNRDARIRESERERLFKRGIPVIFMFAITAGIYGYSLGRKSGYLDGVHAGYVKGGQELMASWRDYAEAVKKSAPDF